MDKIIKSISTVDLSKLTAGALNDIINSVNSNFQAVVNSPVMQGLQGATPEIKKFTFSSKSTGTLLSVYKNISTAFSSAITKDSSLFPASTLGDLTDWAWWCVTGVDGTSYTDYPLFPACSYTADMKVNADNANGGISALDNKCVIYASGVGESYATAAVKDKASAIEFSVTPGTVPFINNGYWIINGVKSEETAQGPKGEPGLSSQINMCRAIAVEDSNGKNIATSSVFVCGDVTDLLTNSYPKSDSELTWANIDSTPSTYDGHLLMISTGIWKAATTDTIDTTTLNLNEYFVADTETGEKRLEIKYDSENKQYYFEINEVKFVYTTEYVQMCKCIVSNGTASLTAVGMPFNDAFIRFGIDTYLGRFLTKSDIVTGFAHKASNTDVSGLAKTSLIAEDVTDAAGNTVTGVTKTDSVTEADGTTDISAKSTHTDKYGHVKSALSDATSFPTDLSYKCDGSLKVNAGSSETATLHLLGIDDSNIAGTAETIRKVGLDNVITAIKDAIVPLNFTGFTKDTTAHNDFTITNDVFANIKSEIESSKLSYILRITYPFMLVYNKYDDINDFTCTDDTLSFSANNDDCYSPFTVASQCISYKDTRIIVFHNSDFFNIIKSRIFKKLEINFYNKWNNDFAYGIDILNKNQTIHYSDIKNNTYINLKNIYIDYIDIYGNTFNGPIATTYNNDVAGLNSKNYPWLFLRFNISNSIFIEAENTLNTYDIINNLISIFPSNIIMKN